MKNLFKHLKVFVVVLLIVLSIGVLAACGKDGATPKPSGSTVFDDGKTGITDDVTIIDSLDGVFDASQQSTIATMT